MPRFISILLWRTFNSFEEERYFFFFFFETHHSSSIHKLLRITWKMKYLSCLFKETRRKNIGMKKVFFSPWQVKNLRTEECQIDRSSYDLCVSSTWNLVAKNNVWERKKKERKRKMFLRCRKLALACWSAVGTLKRRFLSLRQYVDLSNWTTGVDHWSANSWLFEGSGLIRTNLDRPGSRFGHLLPDARHRRHWAEIICWFLNRLRWISDILAGAVYLNRPTWISMVFFFFIHLCRWTSIRVNPCGIVYQSDYSFFVSSFLEYTFVQYID